MIKKPQDAKKFNVDQASVDFYEFQQDDITYYYFDTSMCSAPEPMINAMVGLRLLEKSSQRLVMINHTIPNGLFPKIQDNFEFEFDALPDGMYEITFSFKTGNPPVTDFNDTHCDG